MKNLFLFLILLSAVGGFAHAQAVVDGKKIGIVNGATAEMPHPVYPAEAQHQCAAGEVQILVEYRSTGGRPISARAIAGNPLLRNSAVDAANKAVFNPLVHSPGEIKLEGILVYKFTSPKPYIKCLFKDQVVNKLVKYFPKSNIKDLIKNEHLKIEKETQVKVLIVVAESGKILYASALPGSGFPLLEKHAEMLARQTTFSYVNDLGQIRVRCYLLIKFKPNGDVNL